MRQSRVLARLAVLFSSLCLTLLVLEGALRFAVPQWASLVPQRFMTETADGVLSGVPNFDGRIAGVFGDFDVALRLDARGFRNPPGADLAAPLAFVGDSFCQGWGVTREQSFPALVSAELALGFYNYCTVAADLLDDLRIVRTWMPPRRDGATVLTVTFENDVLAYRDTTGDDAASSSVQGLSRGRVGRWLMNHSALFDVGTSLARQNATIVAAVRRLGLVSGVPVVEGGGAKSIAASVRMVGRIREAAGGGTFLVLLVPPRPGQVEFVDYGAFVAALADAGFDVLDPRAEPGVTISTIPHDGHWDARTHAAIAPLVAERLRAAARR